MIERIVRTSIHGPKVPPNHNNNWFYEKKDGLEKVNERILVYEKYHIHVGVYEPKSPPTLFETIENFLSAPSLSASETAYYRDEIRKAYQREKGETDE